MRSYPVKSWVCLPVFMAFICSAQYIENSCPAPSEHITGMTEYGSLFAIDSMTQMIYEMNGWSGYVYDTIPLPWVACSPVGLTNIADTLMFAESGSALVRMMTPGGAVIGSCDLSVYGLQSITGLSYSSYTNELFIADASSNTIYCCHLPLSSGDIEEYMVLEDCPEIHDIGATVYGIAVACEDSISPVRIYESPSYYYTLGYGDYSSAVGVGLTCEGNRFYFSDPDMGLIHRYCIDMGGIEGQSSNPPELECSIPNPSEGSVNILLNLIEGGKVSVVVADLTGREIVPIFDGPLSNGTHSIRLEQAGLPSGIYLLKLECNGVLSTYTFTIIRN